MSRQVIGLLCIAILNAGLPARASREDIVVLANQNVAESMELARYYMKARGLAEERLIALDVPATETISRALYETNIRDPVTAVLREKGWADQILRQRASVREHETEWNTIQTSLRYVVSMYGMPLRVAETRPRLLVKASAILAGAQDRNWAAVDSELALLLYPPHPISGFVPNPLYDVHRLEDAAGSAPVLLAARLDGPSAAVVKDMIDGAQWGDKYGLCGRVYFDARGPHYDGYFMGDQWLRSASREFRDRGFDTVVDDGDSIWGVGFPMDAPALYLGWYFEHIQGPFLQPDFRFQPGAVAYHLHSTAAATLRSTTNHWTGPLLARGACASFGAVYEPYLAYTPHLDIFARRLCDGYTFGESMYMSMPALSWQVAVVGDPLYRPFGRSLEQQVKALQQDSRPEVEWAYLRQANRLVREGRFNLALDFLRARLAEQESAVLRERLAELYALNNLANEARAEYERVLAGRISAAVRVRIGTRLAPLHRASGQDPRAAAPEQGMLKHGSPAGRWPPAATEALTADDVH